MKIVTLVDQFNYNEILPAQKQRNLKYQNPKEKSILKLIACLPYFFHFTAHLLLLIAHFLLLIAHFLGKMHPSSS